MSIDIRSEQPIPLGEVPKLSCIPRRRGGGRLHCSTAWRWALRGTRGVKLEVIRVGGTLCTSLEALQRFFDRLAGNTNPAPAGGTAADPREVERALDELGVRVRSEKQSTERS